jgi:hypothetical protein
MIVLVIDTGARVYSHVEGLVSHQKEGDGVRLLFSGDDVAIDFQYAAAAFAKAGAIVRMVKSDPVLARSERIRPLPSGKQSNKSY